MDKQIMIFLDSKNELSILLLSSFGLIENILKRFESKNILQGTIFDFAFAQN